MRWVIIAFSVSFFVFGIMMLIRNEIVYKIRTRRLDEICKKGDELIKQGKDWQHLYEEYDQISYVKSLFLIHKWTYSNFYGKCK